MHNAAVCGGKKMACDTKERIIEEALRLFRKRAMREHP